MRRHVNGNVTGADFLVDLRCLGVKDVHWFFNEYESSLMEKFSVGGHLQPTDYATAHNIVYAGYEFALEFGIQPHKDFAVARFILEEDTDDIPLMDIETGDNGIPHLIEYHPGQYADALAKLKKNAGEGNYHYTTALAGDTGSSKEDDVETDDEPIALSDIPEGKMDLTNVRDVVNADLLDIQQVEQRKPLEQLICQAEVLLRLYLKYEQAAVTEHAVLLDDEKNRYGTSGLGEQVVGMKLESLEKELELYLEFLNKGPENGLGMPDVLRQEEVALHQHADKLIMLCMLYENALDFHQSGEILSLLQPYLQQHTDKVLLQLIQAFENFVVQRNTGMDISIINARYLKDAFPAAKRFGHAEFIFFRVLQLLRQLRLGNLRRVVAYYDALNEVEDIMLHTPLLIIIYKELLPLLQSDAEKRMGPG